MDFDYLLGVIFSYIGCDGVTGCDAVLQSPPQRNDVEKV
jgi:hypothetical protein